MVKFNKNGQGYFDFDLNELEKETSFEFMREVEWALDGRYIEKVMYYDSGDYVVVTILTPALIKELTFEKKTKTHWHGVVTRNVLDLFKGGLNNV